MNVFDLAAKITLDTSGYTDGLKTVAKVGAAALGATGAALFTFGKNSVSTGKEFDSSMSQIAATLGYTTDDIKNNVNGAGDAFASLRTKAKEMGAETNFSASEAADGLNILAMSGYDAEQSMSMIEDVLHLAAAGSMDMGSAAKFVSGTMKGFNDATKDSGYYADLMAKGATLANTSVAQLGEAMSSGAATSAAYSQSADSMTIALLRLAEQGEVGSAAGTALAAAMKNLYTPTDQAATALKTLGVAVYDESGNARDFNTVVDELEASFAGMTEEQKNAYKQTIFGIQGLSAYNKMVVTGKKRQDEWSKSLRAASEGAGEAAKQYDTMTDNLEGDIDILKSAADGFKIEVSDRLMPSIREFVQFGSESISNFTKAFSQGGLNGLAKAVGDALSNLIKRVSQKLPSFVKAGSEMLHAFVNGIIEAAPELFNSGVEIIANLGESISNSLPQLIPKAAEAVATIIRGLTQNARTLIDGGIKLFVNLVQAFKEAVPIIIKELPALLKEIVTAIGANMGDIMTEILPALFAAKAGSAIFSGIKDGISSKKAEIMSLMTGPEGLVVALAGSLTLLGAAIANSFDEAYEEAREKAGKLTESQQELINKIHEEAEKWDEVKEKRKEAAEKVNETVGSYRDLWEKLKDCVDEQGKVKKGHEDEVEMLTGELKEALGIEIKLVDGQIENYGKLQETIDKTIEKKKAELMLAAFEDDYKDALKRRKEAQDNLTKAEDEFRQAQNEQNEAAIKVAQVQERINRLDQDGMKGTYEYQSAYDALNRELSEAQGEFDGATDKLNEWGGAITDANKDLTESKRTVDNYNSTVNAVAHGGIEEIKNATVAMENSMKSATNATKGELIQQTKDYLTEWQKQKADADKYGDAMSREMEKDARAAVEAAVSRMETLAPGTAKQIRAAIKAGQALKPNWAKIGENANAGIAGGFKASSYLVKDAARNAISSAIQAAKKVALIHSPSKLFRDEVGMMLGKGLALGLEDADDLVRRASEGLIESADDFDDEGFDVQAVDTGEQAPGGITINVYGAEGQNVNSLADEVAERLQRMYRKEVARFA